MENSLAFPSLAIDIMSVSNPVKTIEIQLPDGSSKPWSTDQSFQEFILEFLPFLKSKALGVELDGTTLVDLSYKPQTNCKVKFLTFQDKDGKEIFHHSTAHLLGQAVQRLWKDAKLTVGPVIETGPGFFYYDIDFAEEVITTDHLPKIEAEMAKIVKEGLDVHRSVLT